ncbi:MAG: DJ-1/PfpI family protein [Myxococcales bacterium]
MEIAILVFEGITALDAVGPYEVLARVPQASVRFVAPQAGPVRTDNRSLGLLADHGVDQVSRCDLLLVSGGYGQRRLERDPKVLEWVRSMDQHTQITASVCTGALVLGAAGLLRGKRACTHWAQRARLAEFGALVTEDRVTRDGKYATAAGVSAGIDLALSLVMELAGVEVAEAIQLAIEYDPMPPLHAGNPTQAPQRAKDSGAQPRTGSGRGARARGILSGAAPRARPCAAHGDGSACKAQQWPPSAQRWPPVANANDDISQGVRSAGR